MSEEYLKESEPGKKYRKYVWDTAIGLQAVDGLETSEYLKETAKKNIDGDISLGEVQTLIDTYYRQQIMRKAGQRRPIRFPPG